MLNVDAIEDEAWCGVKFASVDVQWCVSQIEISQFLGFLGFIQFYVAMNFGLYMPRDKRDTLLA